MDLNDAPSDKYFVDAPVIKENAAINTMMGRLDVSDEDEDDSHQFAIVDTSQYFRVDEQGTVYSQGILIMSKPLSWH